VALAGSVVVDFSGVGFAVVLEGSDILRVEREVFRRRRTDVTNGGSTVVDGRRRQGYCLAQRERTWTGDWEEGRCWRQRIEEITYLGTAGRDWVMDCRILRIREQMLQWKSNWSGFGYSTSDHQAASLRR